MKRVRILVLTSVATLGFPAVLAVRSAMVEGQGSIGQATHEVMAGASIYAAKCAICHQPDGQGIPGIYPPLVDTVGKYAGAEEGRAYLVHSLSYGILGAITVKDQPYNGMMPSFPQFSHQEIADVLNYVLLNFNQNLLPRNCKPLTSEEVKRYRTEGLSPTDVRDERQKMIDKLMKESNTRSALPDISGEAEIYVRQCQCCHRADGRGVPNVIPSLKDVGLFTGTPRGRAYLVRVPGIAEAPLSDSQITTLLNWMLIAFSSDRLPKGFTPITLSEVKQHRGSKLLNVTRERAELVRDFKRARVLD